MGMFWVFDMKGGVVVASNMKNTSCRTCFVCLCKLGLEGVRRVDGEDPNMPPFMCLGLRREEEVGWLVVVSNMKNASRRTRFACLCEPGLEGMCRMDGEDPNMPPFTCLGLWHKDKTTNIQIVPMWA